MHARGLLVVVFLITGCAGARRVDVAQPPSNEPSRPPAPPAAAPPVAPPPAASPIAQDVLAAIDSSIDPCREFYQYACGTWLRSTPLPPDKPIWSRGAGVVRERNHETLREVLEADGERLGTYYDACMDEQGIEARGLEPLQAMLAGLAAVADARSLMEHAGRLHALQVPVLFSIDVDGDFTDPDLAIAHVSQGGLGLPDRDYYLQEDEGRRALRADYQAHVARMLEMAGASPSDAERDAQRVLAFETDLARSSRPRAELRDPETTYHKIDVPGLQGLTPALPWDVFLAAAGHPGVRDVNVAVPEFFQGLDALVGRSQPATLAAYLRWHLLRGTATLLPRPFVDEAFAFYGRRLAGQKELQPRWKRCVDSTTGAMGELLGKAFVERRFVGDSKAIALDMIGRIEEAFAGRLPQLAWMDDRTRERAVAKMQAIRNKIGYPDRWRDYSALQVQTGRHFENALAARRFEFDRNLAKIGTPVDPGEWFMSPPEVNAYYHPLLNEIVFPAGILQPPYFSREFPAAMNFGAIGMVMGHELTHGFDDSGRKFDAEGRLIEWWEPEVADRFAERASCVSKLYETYEVEPGLHLNGALTLGENIADLGGIKQAYLAYQDWVADHGEPAAVVPGMTDDQLFFLAFAQPWCTVVSPETQRMRVTIDTHSPPRFRVNGPLANLPAFAEAFACAPGTAMNPVDRCEVW